MKPSHPLLWRFLLGGLFVCVIANPFIGYAWGSSLAVAVSDSPLSTPFFVAEKQGYFRDEGLDLAIVGCPTGGACLKQLLESKVQLATSSDLPIMFRSFESVPFTVLATFAASSYDARLIARKSSGIRSSKDIKGRRVALVRGTSGQYVLDLTLLAAGLDPRAVTIVDLDLKHLELAAANQQIDAFALFQPGAYQMVKLLGADALVLPIPRLYTLTFNLTALRGKTGVSEDDQVKILRALDRAMGYIKAEPATSMRILQQRLNLDAADVAALWPDYRFALSLNQSLIATLESTAKWAIQEQLVKARAAPNYLDFIDVGPLKRVQPSVVTVVK